MTYTLNVFFFKFNVTANANSFIRYIRLVDLSVGLHEDFIPDGPKSMPHLFALVVLVTLNMSE